MDSRQKIILGIVVVSIFIFLITVLVFVYAAAPDPSSIPPIFTPFLQYHVHFMVLMGLFGVMSGVIVYSLMNRTIAEQKKAVEKVAETNTGIIMRFLGKDDAAAMKLLLQKGGMTTQGEIAKEAGMSRLRAHRTARRLEERGIIHVEKHGKVNLLRLVDELKQK
ncbi:Uncharacterised protein [uncultured archaeon]|nr:Uncharacterised protein [uncultured archaeon]